MAYKRVHGDFQIKRSDVTVTNYKKARPWLEKDFHNICGYCGKNFNATLSYSEIDHFKPKSKYPTYTNDYNNLVLSCPTCNNKKRDDWPSNNPELNISENGLEGYIDPATQEFDAHLARENDGTIIGLTEVGQYMVKKFDFYNRPIKEIYRIQQLYFMKEKLKNKNNKNKKFCELCCELSDLLQLLFIQKER